MHAHEIATKQRWANNFHAIIFVELEVETSIMEPKEPEKKRRRAPEHPDEQRRAKLDESS